MTIRSNANRIMYQTTPIRTPLLEQIVIFQFLRYLLHFCHKVYDKYLSGFPIVAVMYSSLLGYDIL